MAYTWPPSVAEVKLQLGKTDTTDDPELAGFIDGVVAVIEYLTGPIVSTVFTEWHDGGRDTICPLRLPVVSVTSVTEYLGTMTYALTVVADPSVATLYSVTVDSVTGTITRRVVGGTSCFAPGRRNIQVVYNAGFATVPPNVRWAALELVRKNWTSTQNGRGRGSGQDDGQMLMGYFVPNNVREALMPNERLPGMA